MKYGYVAAMAVMLLCVGCGTKDGGVEVEAPAETNEALALEAKKKPVEVEKEIEEASEPTKGRPAHMPCKITQVEKGTGEINEVYTIEYDDDGRMTEASRQVELGNGGCRTLSDKKCLFGATDRETTYSYDDKGRLETVKRNEGKDGTLTLIYDDKGQVSAYTFTEDLENGQKNSRRGEVTKRDWKGRIEKIVETGKIYMGGLKEHRAELKGIYSMSEEDKAARYPDPVVWPFAHDRPYLRYAAHGGKLTIGSSSTRFSYGYRFDADGRMTKVRWSSPVGENTVDFKFVYDCKQ